MTEAIWSTVAGVLTLAIFSFLYKDNPFYKFAEYLFVGVAAGWFFCLQIYNVFLPSLWVPMTGAWSGAENARWTDHLLVVPFLLGVLMFSRFSRGIAWLSRWPMALMVGAFSGLAIIGFAQGDLVTQLQASMLDLAPATFAEGFASWILLVGLVTSLVYFFFSTEHRGAVGGIARVGIAFLMISFGASYGFTVMARISLLIGRLQFLFRDWPESIKQLL